MANQVLSQELGHYVQLGLTSIPLRQRSKKSLLKWGNGQNPMLRDLERWAPMAVMRDAQGKRSSGNDKVKP
jgi:hypothetical protein